MDANRATVIGWGVATIVLALFVVLAVHTMGEMKFNRARQQLQDAVRFHEGQAVWNEKEAEGMAQELSRLSKDAEAIDGLRKRLAAAQSRGEALTGDIARTREAASSALDAVRMRLAELRKQSLGSAFDSLTTSSGRNFTGVKILAATEEGLRIEHTDGSARIPSGEVPSPLREKLGYDLDVPSDTPPTATTTATDAGETPPPVAPVATQPVIPSAPINSAQTERLLLEQKQELERAARLRQQADRFDAEATKLEEEAREHRAKAARARAAGRSSMQDAEATKDTQVANGLRSKSATMRNEALRIEQSIHRSP